MYISAVCFVVFCAVTSSSFLGDEGGEGRQLVQLDPQNKMSYTEQATKRQDCQRLTRFMS